MVKDADLLHQDDACVASSDVTDSSGNKHKQSNIAKDWCCLVNGNMLHYYIFHPKHQTSEKNRYTTTKTRNLLSEITTTFLNLVDFFVFT